MRLALILTVAVSLQAADDAKAIILRWVDAQQRNDRRASNFAWVEEADHFTYDKSGEAQKDRSETSEVVPVDGLPSKRLIARDGKPLEADEQARVDKMMRQAAADRKRRAAPPPTGGRVSFSPKDGADLGSGEEILLFFKSRLVGEEEIRGHKAWVIESTPKPGIDPGSDHEKELMSFQMKIWIDQTDNVVLRQVLTVTSDRLYAKPGSTVTIEYDKINADTWHEVAGGIEVYRMRGKESRPWSRTAYKLSNFKPAETTAAAR